jgi:hypothetical protein
MDPPGCPAPADSDEIEANQNDCFNSIALRRGSVVCNLSYRFVAQLDYDATRLLYVDQASVNGREDGLGPVFDL